MNNNRRNFFTKFGTGALATAVVSAIPLKLFASKKSEVNTNKKVTVQIHPSAVKRNK
jgi:hypothetical protein